MEERVKPDEFTTMLRDIIFGDPPDPVLRGIGKFVYLFSQLEFMLRGLVADSLKLDARQFDTITANYDFRSLCAVAKDLLIFDRQRNILAFHGEIEYDKLVIKFITSCLQVNDLRVKVAHGTWTASTGARHISRQKLTASYVFGEPGVLTQALETLGGLIAGAIVLLGRDALKFG